MSRCLTAQKKIISGGGVKQEACELIIFSQRGSPTVSSVVKIGVGTFIFKDSTVMN